MENTDEVSMAKRNSIPDDGRTREPTYHTTDANYTLPNE